MKIFKQSKRHCTGLAVQVVMMSLESALITSGISSNTAQAQQIIHSMTKQILEDGADPISLLEDVGLEPDYIFDLLW